MKTIPPRERSRPPDSQPGTLVVNPGAGPAFTGITDGCGGGSLFAKTSWNQPRPA